MKNKLVLTLIALTLLVGACSLAGDPLDGTKWQLLTMDGSSPIEGSNVTLEFADQRLSGSSGCNAYGAEYKVMSGKLEIDMVAMTAMACEDNAIMEQEARFSGLIDQIAKFEVTESGLELYDEDGNLLLEFIPQE